VRHALEKDVAARTSSVGEFLIELRNAVNATPETAAPARDTSQLDLHRTLVSPLSGTNPEADPGLTTNVQTPIESLSGVGNKTTVGEEARTGSVTSPDVQASEQEARERAAREELAREAEARREAEDAAARKKKAEEDRLRKEQEEKEERERQQREQLERVARQASELEERLARLSTSMTPGAEAEGIDPEATQLHRSAATVAPGQLSATDRAARLQVAIPQKSRNTAMYLIAAVVALILLGGAITAYVMTREKPIVIDPVRPTPSPNVTPAPSFKADLVEIPGGTFQMGRDNGPPQERPAHTVTVKTFFLDRNEIVNGEYAEFVQETNGTPPSHWPDGKPVFGQENWPVVNVSTEDAKSFAAWRSKRDGVTYRLPTEEEWEYAARGGDQDYLYPWGNDWQNDRAVVSEAFPKSVGSFPGGKNRWGVMDMIGNVWEWTSTTIAFYPGNKGSALPPEYRTWIVKRGGSFLSDPNDKNNPITATYRDFAPASTKHATIGFRLARSAE
jgi:formylglycine-generating enzyme required for sulfatase activity